MSNEFRNNGQLFEAFKTAIDSELIDQAEVIKSKAEELDPNLKNKLDQYAKMKLKQDHTSQYHAVILGASESMPRPTNTKEFNILSNPSLAVRFSDCYSKKLMDAFRKKKDFSFYLTNLSFYSYSIRDIAKRWQSSVHFLNPNMIILHFGIVDSWIRRDSKTNYVLTDFSEFRRIFATMLEYKKETAPSKKLIIVPILEPKKEMHDQIQIDSAVSYNKAALEVAEEIDDKNISFLSFSNCHDEIYHGDGYHLSSKGHDYIYNSLFKIIEAEVNSKCEIL